jgi:hypothetical protein
MLYRAVLVLVSSRMSALYATWRILSSEVPLKHGPDRRARVIEMATSSNPGVLRQAVERPDQKGLVTHHSQRHLRD